MSFCHSSLSRTSVLVATTLAAIASLSTSIQAQSLVGGSATYAASEPAAAPGSPLTTTPSSRTWHDTAIPADKFISAQVREGVLTIDGMVAKVQLNYNIREAGYLYFFIPGVGTAVVSQVQMTNAVKVKDAFHGSNLSFTVGGHSIELSSKSTILSQEKGKADLYVHLDTNTASLDRYPMMGYGNTTGAPYVWPLSAPTEKDTSAHVVQPPPMPKSMLPRVQTNSTVTTVVKAEDMPASSVATSSGR